MYVKLISAINLVFSGDVHQFQPQFKDRLSFSSLNASEYNKLIDKGTSY